MNKLIETYHAEMAELLELEIGFEGFGLTAAAEELRACRLSTMVRAREAIDAEGAQQ